MAIKEKLENLKKNNQYTHEKWDPIIFDKIKNGVFGGNMKYCITGAAPI